MDYLARKISRSKWESRPYVGPEDVRADAVTGCLRTSNDTLSLWRCSQDNSDVSEVVLAFAASMDVIEGIHIVLLDQNDLNNDGLILRRTPENANTPVKELSNRHIDLENLTMTKLSSLARRIANNVRQGSNLYHFTKKDIREILCRAVKNNRLNIQALNAKIQKEIKKYI